MALSICAFNSIELNDQELMEDGLNLFVDWDLSDFFSDLLISRDLAMNNEDGEFDQIASILKVDIEPLYKMSNYWDKVEEERHLSGLNNDADRQKQLQIIQENNASLYGNIDKVYETILSLEAGILREDDLKYQLIKHNPGFYNDYKYFSKVEFVKPLDADTVYFKFKT